jgi:hypothetical protein
MADWIVYAIWVLMGLWSSVELMGAYLLASLPSAKYSKAAKITSICWVISIVFWISFRIFG